MSEYLFEHSWDLERRHDIVADELEEDAYNLVHSRLVLDHLPARHQVLKRMAAALRPGGWMVQEVFDWSSLVVARASVGGERHTRLYESLREVFAAVGASSEYGRQLPLEFRACQEDGYCTLYPTLVAVWGRRPLS